MNCATEMRDQNDVEEYKYKTRLNGLCHTAVEIEQPTWCFEFWNVDLEIEILLSFGIRAIKPRLDLPAL